MLFLISACNDGLNECFSGRGNIVTKRMGLYEFSNVIVKDNIELTLKNGEYYTIEITGGENVIPMLEISISGNTLSLGNNSTCPMFKKPWDGLKILLTLPYLDTLIAKSHGSVSSEGAFHAETFVIIFKESPSNIDFDIDCTNFHLQYLSGTGDITIRGNAYRGAVFHTGFGLIDLTELSTGFLNLNTRSANHSFVRGGEKYFFVLTGGDGNVYYVNDPATIEWHDEGKGELIRIYD